MAPTHGTRGLDRRVSDRVSEEIEIFSEALEKALANPTLKTLDKLEEAADQLMRATGRVMIELGRLRTNQEGGS